MLIVVLSGFDTKNTSHGIGKDVSSFADLDVEFGRVYAVGEQDSDDIVVRIAAHLSRSHNE
jgi:hypothetical protein